MSKAETILWQYKWPLVIKRWIDAEVVTRTDTSVLMPTQKIHQCLLFLTLLFYFSHGCVDSCWNWRGQCTHVSTEQSAPLPKNGLSLKNEKYLTDLQICFLCNFNIFTLNLHSSWSITWEKGKVQRQRPFSHPWQHCATHTDCVWHWLSLFILPIY